MMKTLVVVVVLSLSLTILSFGGAHAATISFKNNCGYTVWPGTLTSDQKPQLSTTGFELASQANFQLDTPVPWNGRFWARTGCSTDASGKFVCSTADCASGQVTCNGNGAIPSATLAEFNIPAGGGQDFYDVSLVDGFNLPMSVTPQGGTGDCKTPSCRANVNAVCPSELQKKGSDGSVVACLSACVAFNQPQYCCTPPQNTPETCPPTNYSQIFHEQCPDAYSYAYDDKRGTFTCNGGPNYVITFCP
ncbi:Glucan endo-1 3-beta-glucosidase [Prunus yedoensis var. nudiflora]|uniref:Glucan endo-1 3-beta-glucosidase n=1 Tax=Prunus yedoensis var. nudiflora TaxID=2094558 RepID=A0A314Z0P9_PRUYE|nr:Glucan endo-1 3-beta-glucosidase [Prunus yedoensis var. nudiflora]